MKSIIILLFALINISNAQWNQIGSINTTELRGVKFFDEHTGITVGAGGIWRSANSGVNWTQVLISGNINAVSFYNSNEGMAVGDSGKIFKTTDNGITWLTLISGTTNNLNSIAVCNPSADLSTYFSLVVGQNGIFLRSFNSGNSWSIGSAYTQDLYHIWIMNPGTGGGFATGASNSETYFVTANGGTYWQPILNTTNGGYHLYSGAYLTGQTCICVGSTGRIRKTTNWGLNWSYPVSNTTNNLYAVIFINLNTGYAAGDNGIILKTTDAGNNWTNQNAGISDNLKDITFINEYTGWAVGHGGNIYRIGIPVNITNNGSEIPEEFKLYQNYPNPFNPNTKIRFDIAQNSMVNLKIYDIQGNELKTFVNGILKPGNYEVELNMSDFSSGIYFYKLTFQKGNHFSNSFILSKKLIVLK